MPMANQALSCDPVFSSHMVLQRERPLVVSGRAQPLSAVSVRLHNHLAHASANADGRFRITMPAMEAGGPYQVVVTSGLERVVLEDVLIGDLWLCSGQSNMQLRLSALTTRYRQEILEASDPQLRLLMVPYRTAMEPQQDLAGARWSQASPQAVEDFSAVAYFFGRDLRVSQGIPIGLMCAAWGGTIIETWIDPQALQELPSFAGVPHPLAGVREANRRFRTIMAAWRAWLDRHDPGVGGQWASADFDDSAWPSVRLPRPHADCELSEVVGTVWYRHALEIPASWGGRALNLYLAAIDGYEEVYLNGQLVAQTDATTAHPENQFRCYTGIPSSHLRAGARNVIAVRVCDTGTGPGGICQRHFWCTVQIEPADHTPSEVLFINDHWRYHVGYDGRASDDWSARLGMPVAAAPGAAPFQEPPDQDSANYPSLLCQGMIMPLTPLAITGVIWYQGEANVTDAALYRQLLPALFGSWRRLWGQPELPFLVVQLANHRDGEPAFAQPVDSDWAHLRDAQLAAMSDPHCGLAVAIDIGEAEDVHPQNKLDVGLRLARQARHLVYGEDSLVPSGPHYHAHTELPDGRLAITFTYATGLATRDGAAVRQLAVASADGRFVWAESTIVGSQLVVGHPEGLPVTAVRYAWANHPPGANLVNGAGLPASPFRSDELPQSR